MEIEGSAVVWSGMKREPRFPDPRKPRKEIRASSLCRPIVLDVYV